jgi:hypothetical protein
MGRMSELQIEQGERCETALNILIAAGVLARCPMHEECTFIENDDVTAAYKLAMHQWGHGEHREFESARKLTDKIKEVWDEHGVWDCQHPAHGPD